MSVGIVCHISTMSHHRNHPSNKFNNTNTFNTGGTNSVNTTNHMNNSSTNNDVKSQSVSSPNPIISNSSSNNSNSKGDKSQNEANYTESSSAQDQFDSRNDTEVLNKANIRLGDERKASKNNSFMSNDSSSHSLRYNHMDKYNYPDHYGDHYGMHSGPSMPHLFYKTKMCPWFPLGRCTHGDPCSYAHSEQELRQIPRTRMCDYVMSNLPCPVGDLCTFAHSQHELSDEWQVNIWYKNGGMRGGQNSYYYGGRDNRWNRYPMYGRGMPSEPPYYHNYKNWNPASSSRMVSNRDGIIPQERSKPLENDADNHRAIDNDNGSNDDEKNFENVDSTPAMNSTNSSANAANTTSDNSTEPHNNNPGMGSSTPMMPPHNRMNYPMYPPMGNMDTKTMICPYLSRKGGCYREHDCRFSHSEKEIQAYLARYNGIPMLHKGNMGPRGYQMYRPNKGMHHNLPGMLGNNTMQRHGQPQEGGSGSSDAIQGLDNDTNARYSTDSGFNYENEYFGQSSGHMIGTQTAAASTNPETDTSGNDTKTGSNGRGPSGSMNGRNSPLPAASQSNKPRYNENKLDNGGSRASNLPPRMDNMYGPNAVQMMMPHVSPPRNMYMSGNNTSSSMGLSHNMPNLPYPMVDNPQSGVYTPPGNAMGRMHMNGGRGDPSYGPSYWYPSLPAPASQSSMMPPGRMPVYPDSPHMTAMNAGMGVPPGVMMPHMYNAVDMQGNRFSRPAMCMGWTRNGPALLPVFAASTEELNAAAPLYYEE